MINYVVFVSSVLCDLFDVLFVRVPLTRISVWVVVLEQLLKEPGLTLHKRHRDVYNLRSCNSFWSLVKRLHHFTVSIVFQALEGGEWECRQILCQLWLKKMQGMC